MASGFPLNKRLELQKKLSGLGEIVLAYSGGVDSDFLLAVAVESGLKSLVAVAVDSDFMTAKELDRAKTSAKKHGVELVVRRAEVLKNEALVINTARRCYFCKHLVFSLIKDVADEKGIAHCIHGVNVDDLGDYRPGLEAAAELGFSAPMAEVGLSKEEIRAGAKEMGLATWDLPSQSCLAARIPYGQRISAGTLNRIALAEAWLRDRVVGRTDRLRVRCHGDMARIETEVEIMEGIMADPELRLEVSGKLKELGFVHVSLDLDGYTTGKMNAGLSLERS